MDFSILISSALGLLAGAVVALKVIAPLTRTKVDDKVLERLEQLEKMVAAVKK